MSPDHKGMLIKELQQETGEMIGMWGDGANDWQALKVADAGLSLSEAEASIAAPFTSNIDNISSAVDLLRLGRFSLDYSYWLIKYLIINSVIEFLETLILYLNTHSISDTQYACIDILWLFPVGVILWFIDPISELPSYNIISVLEQKTIIFKSPTLRLVLETWMLEFAFLFTSLLFSLLSLFLFFFSF